MPDININEVVSRPGSERGILGIILNNNDKILECEAKDLYANHFSVPGNQILYSAICYLYSREDITHIDSLVVYNTITDPEAKQSVDSLGGMSYIDSLIQSRVSDNLNYYITQVRNCAIKRLAYAFGAQIQEDVLESSLDQPAEELLNRIQQNTLELVLQNEEESEVYEMGTDTEEVLRRRAENPMTIPGFAMGWDKYDRITQGQKPNELTVVVARSKAGKSAFLLNHAKKFSVNDGIPGLYIDTEMTSREQEDRLLACISGVPHEEIVSGMFARDTIYGEAVAKQAALMEALDKIRQAPFFHIYMPGFTIDKVTALVRKYYLQRNLGYVIFDYIKLPNSEVNNLENAQEYQRLGYITTCLKDLSGICGIPVITAAQANRSGDMDGDESDIGGSYRIIQMATRIIFLRQKTDQELATDGWQNGNMKIKVGFQRSGQSSNENIDFVFDKQILRFKEVHSD